MGASGGLEPVADQVVQVVKVMSGLNRFRFAIEGNLLASWEAASNIFATPQPADTKPTPGSEQAPGGEVRPAA